MMGSWQIECKDVMTWCKEYTGKPFSAMLVDPPYHLTTITKRFGKEDAAPAQYGRDGAFQRMSKGFMGSTWDGETDGKGIAFDPKTWAALSKHLLARCVHHGICINARLA
jgi:site-specific DNA-methyltransferase (adenine-specific)